MDYFKKRQQKSDSSPKKKVDDKNKTQFSLHNLINNQLKSVSAKY